MPGLILEINVVVGQTVQENDPLLILEKWSYRRVMA
jgi:biotin carboxyl carrier protein